MDPLRDGDWDDGFEVFKELLRETQGFRELIDEWPMETLHSPHPHPPLSSPGPPLRPPGMDVALHEGGMSIRDVARDMDRLVRKYRGKETGILEKVHCATAAFESDFMSDMDEFFKTRKQHKPQNSNLSRGKRERTDSSTNSSADGSVQLVDVDLSAPSSKSQHVPSMAFAGDVRGMFFNFRPPFLS
jgi:hypothetical protein